MIYLKLQPGFGVLLVLLVFVIAINLIYSLTAPGVRHLTTENSAPFFI